MKTVGIIQSNYIPWRGYFDFIDSVDVFVIHDDLQYTKLDWRNRNRLRGPDGNTYWVTVPVTHASSHQLIQETGIAEDGQWKRKHLARFESFYAKAPFFQEVKELFATVLFSKEWKNLSELNVELIRSIMRPLGIDTPLIAASELECEGTKTLKLLAILKKLGADHYVSGPAARAYLDLDLLTDNGIEVSWKDYDYPDYEQGLIPFMQGLSILDTLAWTGFDAREVWHCRGTPWTPAR